MLGDSSHSDARAAGPCLWGKGGDLCQALTRLWMRAAVQCWSISIPSRMVSSTEMCLASVLFWCKHLRAAMAVWGGPALLALHGVQLDHMGPGMGSAQPQPRSHTDQAPSAGGDHVKGLQEQSVTAVLCSPVRGTPRCVRSACMQPSCRNPFAQMQSKNLTSNTPTQRGPRTEQVERLLGGNYAVA